MQMFLSHCIVILLYIAYFSWLLFLWSICGFGPDIFSKISILLETEYRILQDEVEIHRKVQVKSTIYARRKSC